MDGFTAYPSLVLPIHLFRVNGTLVKAGVSIYISQFALSLAHYSRQIAFALIITPASLSAADNQEGEEKSQDTGPDIHKIEMASDEIYHDPQADCIPDIPIGEDITAKLDNWQASLHSGVCLATRWFDQLFGRTIPFKEDEVYGRVSLGTQYTEHDGFKFLGRLRLHAPLNNMNERFNAFVGRVDEDAYLQDSKPALPGAIQDGILGEDASWLLGLGYRPQKYKKNGFSFSAGLKLPLDVYARVRYRWDHEFNAKNSTRFRQSVFWRSDRGFGTTSRINFFHFRKPDSMLRWENILTVAEDLEGVKWYSGVTLYQNLKGVQGLSVLGFITGETESEVGLREYGLRVTWRRPIAREWMFLELGPSVTWPRETQTMQREISLGFGVLVEVQFGDFRY